MGSGSEPAKLLLPFLQRADELQKHEPLVAYYCRLYAMEKGLKIPQKERTKTTNALLISLMNQLEKDKKSIKIGPEDYLYVEGFASNVFAKADKQDRAGRADLNTAKTFYAAGIFFEILNQFGELQPDIEQKLKYAVWKAADIRKAIKEGRKPEPGPPGGDKDLSIPSGSPTSSYDLRPSENFSSGQPAAGTPTHHAEKDFARNESFPSSYQGSDPSPRPPERVNSYSPSLPPLPPSSYPSSDYHPTDYHQLPQSNNTPDISNHPQHPTDYHQLPQSNNTPDISIHPQHYQTHSYPTDQHPMSQNFHYQENPIPPPPYSFPNFQSDPSFHDSSFPAAPVHQPSYYHSAEASSAPSISNYPSSAATVKYDYGSGNENNHVASQASPSAVAYTYDSNYQPPVEKITEAHRAARFAVGALAFDDVPVAVEFLRKSLELLTNPKAESH